MCTGSNGKYLAVLDTGYWGWRLIWQHTTYMLRCSIQPKNCTQCSVLPPRTSQYFFRWNRASFPEQKQDRSFHVKAKITFIRPPIEIFLIPRFRWVPGLWRRFFREIHTWVDLRSVNQRQSLCNQNQRDRIQINSLHKISCFSVSYLV